jgi:hypothetical protein
METKFSKAYQGLLILMLGTLVSVIRKMRSKPVRLIFPFSQNITKTKCFANLHQFNASSCRREEQTASRLLLLVEEVAALEQEVAALEQEVAVAVKKVVEQAAVARERVLVQEMEVVGLLRLAARAVVVVPTTHQASNNCEGSRSAW